METLKTTKAFVVGYALDIYLRGAIKRERGIPSGKQVRIYSNTEDSDPVQSTVTKVNTSNKISLVEFKINGDVSLSQFAKLGIMNLCNIRLKNDNVISFVISVKM